MTVFVNEYSGVAITGNSFCFSFEFNSVIVIPQTNKKSGFEPIAIHLRSGNATNYITALSENISSLFCPTL